MSALQETNELLRDLLRLQFIQHQDFIWALIPKDPGTWFRRLLLMRRLQKRHHFLSEEEWQIFTRSADLSKAFSCLELAKAWPNFRDYYTKKEQGFINELIAKAQSKTRPEKRAKK